MHCLGWRAVQPLCTHQTHFSFCLRTCALSRANKDPSVGAKHPPHRFTPCASPWQRRHGCVRAVCSQTSSSADPLGLRAQSRTHVPYACARCVCTGVLTLWRMSHPVSLTCGRTLEAGSCVHRPSIYTHCSSFILQLPKAACLQWVVAEGSSSRSRSPLATTRAPKPSSRRCASTSAPTAHTSQGRV